MAAHARGAAAYAAKAAGLAAPNEVTAMPNEVTAMPNEVTAMASEARWQRDHASPAIREVLLRLPCPTRPAGILSALITDLHTQLAERR